MRTLEFFVAFITALLAFGAYGWVGATYGLSAIGGNPGLALLALAAVGYPTALYLLPQIPAARKALYGLIICLCYSGIGLTMQALAIDGIENVLYACDLRLNFDVHKIGRQALNPWLAEIFGLSYLFYYPYLLIRSFSIIKINGKTAERFFLGMVVCYSLGFIGYFVAPALGPRYAIGDSFVPSGPFFAPLAVWLVNHAGSPWAVMPSMHVGATLYTLFFDAAYNRKYFYICLVPALGLCAATVGLGFHYLSDVIGGILVAVIGLWAQSHSGRLSLLVAKIIHLLQRTLLASRMQQFRFERAPLLDAQNTTKPHPAAKLKIVFRKEYSLLK